MVNYANSVVYKIMSLDPEIDDVYVGSTCAFRKRKHDHKKNCCNESSKEYNRYVYHFIRNNGGWDNWSMVVVKAYPDITSEMELLNKEMKWMIKLKATLNKQVPEEHKRFVMPHIFKVGISENLLHLRNDLAGSYKRSFEL